MNTVGKESHHLFRVVTPPVVMESSTLILCFQQRACLFERGLLTLFLEYVLGSGKFSVSNTAASSLPANSTAKERGLKGDTPFLLRSAAFVVAPPLPVISALIRLDIHNYADSMSLPHTFCEIESDVE